MSPIEGVTDQVIEDRTMPATERFGYVFRGWYDNANLTGEAVTELPEKMPAGTTIYYAKWQRVIQVIPYVGTYDGNAHTVIVDTQAGEKVQYKANLLGDDSDLNWTEDSAQASYANVKRAEDGTVQSYTVVVRVVSEDGKVIAGPVDSTVTINPRPVTVTANPAGKMFGEDDPALSAKVEGNLNNDSIVYTVKRPGAGTDEAVKVYPGAVVASRARRQENPPALGQERSTPGA